MFWLLSLVIEWFASSVLSALLQPSPKSDLKPSALGDFVLPTAEEGRVIPWACGTVKISGPNITWRGDLQVKKITQKTGGFLGIGGKKVTTGFRYYLGLEMMLCHGPIDDIVQVLFDDKPIPTGTITVVDGENDIVFGNVPPPLYTATIPPDIYLTPTAVAVAAEAAMVAAYGGGVWKVVYGFHLLPGHTNEFWYSVDFGGSATDILVNLAGVYLTGNDMAASLERQLNYAESQQSGGARVAFEVVFNGDGEGPFGFGKLTILFQDIRGVDGVFIRGIVDYSKSALVNLGWQLGVDKHIVGTSGAFEADFTVGTSRYSFGFGGLGGVLALSDAGFTARGLFALGYEDVIIGAVMGAAALPAPSYLEKVVVSDDQWQLIVHAPDLFGGDSQGGGIVGAIDFYRGTRTPTPNDYMAQMRGVSVSGYPGIVRAVFRRVYFGTSPYLKSVAFVVRCTPDELPGLDTDHWNINGDINPIAQIYRILTNVYWGLGIDPAIIGDSFVAVAETLYSEGLGVSMLGDTPAAAEDAILDILRHVDGAIFPDPFEAKIEVKLARADYDPDDLLELGYDDIDSVEKGAPSWPDTTNFVKIRYVDRTANFTQRVTDERDSANLWAQGGLRSSQTYDFHGISNKANAQLTAMRVLKTVSYPLGTYRLKGVKRRAWKLRPGSVFKLSWLEFGLVSKIVRVTKITGGEMRDNPLTIQVVEEIFNITSSVTPAPTGDGWVTPSTAIQPLSEQRLVEAPYRIPFADGSLRVITLGARSVNKETNGYKVMSDPDGGIAYTETNSVGSLTPVGEVALPLAPADLEMVVGGGVDLPKLQSASGDPFAAGVNLLLVEDEWIAYQSVTDNGDGSFTLAGLARGCIDSTPKAHGVGASAFFYSTGHGLTDPDPYGGLVTVGAKLLPYNGTGQLALDQASRLSCEMIGRAALPVVPPNIKLNAVSYPERIIGELHITWDHRDPTDTGDHFDVSNATTADRGGDNTIIDIYGETGTLLRTVTAASGDTEYVYLAADELADSALDRLNSSLRIVVTKHDSGAGVSLQSFAWSVLRASTSTTTTTDRTLWVPSADFQGLSSHATRGTAGNTVDVIELSGSSDSEVTATITIPDDFASIGSWGILLANAGTSANNVVFRIGVATLNAGDDVVAAPSTADVAFAPSATQDLAMLQFIDDPGVALVAGAQYKINIQRLATAGGDTNANAMAFIGLLLRYSSE